MSYKMTIDRYLDRLAAKSPAPGGGSAAALVGAIGISLLAMAARYTARKTDKGVLYTKLSKILEFAERSRRRLEKLMAEDEAAYLRLSKGLKKRGVKNITRLYKSAAEVPLEVCAILQNGLGKCNELSAYCKTSLVSDLAEAAILLEAGFLAAKFNVEINLGGIKDVVYTRKVRSSLSKSRMSIPKMKRKVLNRIRQRLSQR